jgi:hypothetical protein
MMSLKQGVEARLRTGTRMGPKQSDNRWEIFALTRNQTTVASDVTELSLEHRSIYSLGWV